MVRFDEKNRAFLPVPEIDLRAHRKLIYEPDFSRQITLITVLNFVKPLASYFLQFELIVSKELSVSILQISL